MDLLHTCPDAERVFIVGGCVRDLLIKRRPTDVDIVVSGDAEKIGRELAERINGSFFFLDQERQVVRVTTKTEEGIVQCDFSEMKGVDIHEDLATRDFTINAMAISLTDFLAHPDRGEVIDPFGGRGDLCERRIRSLSPHVFEDDPVRMMRGVRLAAQLGCDLDHRTREQIRASAPRIVHSSAERVRDELFQILSYKDSSPFILFLDELGLLEWIIPEIRPLKYPPDPLQEGLHLWRHSCRTLACLEGFLERLPPQFLFCEDVIHLHLHEEKESGVTREALLKCAALLHDVGKPQTCAGGEKGIVRFLGHERGGAQVNEEIARRLRLSAASSEIIRRLTLYHLRPLLLIREEAMTDRALYRFLRDVGEEGIELLLLAISDARASEWAPRGQLAEGEVHERIGQVLRYRFRPPLPAGKAPFVTGDDLIDLFHLTPGPLFRVILDDVREQEALGEITDREEALQYVRDRLEHPG